ncbi:MAG: YceI family protein [Bacteroidetes bacterium]|nr:YceI family protein [Bacteroidota bacterium]MBK8145484.1 YceI family protein [Bacteroidota bacterium]MBP6315244.1 YceI family protein [Chitinophagaceae bacterium]
MKKTIFTFAIVALLASCQSAPEGETAATAEKQEAATGTGNVYNVDKTASTVSFVGSKPVGTHMGDFLLSEGSFTINEGNITAGNFSIDINSMKITDKEIDAESAGKLQGHLLSPDFFDAAKFGTAKFEITSCVALTGDSTATHTIGGNLTLKDSTKNVTFPAKVTLSDKGATATADFNIDRTQWGLFYGNDKSLGDKFIYPEVKIKFNIVANK